MKLLNFMRYFSLNKAKNVRVRFAPSPTGYLHLGGLRTALYNYFFAKLRGGQFILRIEDTDQSRIVPGAREQLEADLKWAGLEIDEGPACGGHYGPYKQSERLELYTKQVGVLLENGSAYRCFCSDRRLDLLRKEAVRSRQIPKYDNRCRELKREDVETRLRRGDQSCIRFKLTPDCQSFDDLIYGNISYDVALNEGDPVIMKSDGFPTYHFANVVDDHFMEISHVLRGVEWQISTTKHIMLYRAFNWEPPQFAHLPLLMNPDGTKLSKRQGDIKISHYRESGVFPQALINFISASGGGFEKDRVRSLKPQSYSMRELANQFDLREISTHSGKLMPDRLMEFNRLEIQRLLETGEDRSVLIETVKKLVTEKFKNRDDLNLTDEYVTSILTWASNRIDKLPDLTDKLAFVWINPRTETVLSQRELDLMSKFAIEFNSMEMDKEKLNAHLRSFSESNEIPYASFMRQLRSALSGLKEGPSVAEMFEILGKENSMRRLEEFTQRHTSAIKENTLRT